MANAATLEITGSEMSDFDKDQAIEDFIADARIVELGELQRTGDEVLDVIRLSENQHSDILAWLLDPREGHGQGDQILRDVLMAASEAARMDCGLDGRQHTARFFADWPPSRIRTSSFGSAFVARELGMRASDRVDLFVFDPQNGFVLVIENKAGLDHTAEQLDRYKEQFEKLVEGNPHIKNGYKPVFIALDRAFNGDDWSERPSKVSWLHLGYSWLETSAQRALLHVERGNEAARLVVSYCNRQTEWVSPDAKKAESVAASLHVDHRDAIDFLLNSYSGRLETEWLASTKRSDAMLFMLQNKSLMKLLRETRGMVAVRATLAAKVPGLRPELVESERSHVFICPPGWEVLGDDGWWNAYLSIWCSDDLKAKYTLALVWNGAHSKSPEQGEALREKLAAFQPAFAKHATSQRRRVVLESDLSLADLIKCLSDVVPKLQALVR